MLSIAIVEDSNRHLEIIKKHITANNQYKLLTTAKNGFDFVSYCLLEKTLPDIALIDIQMNIMDGIALTDFLQQFFPAIKCIGVTGYANKEVISDMMACGAMGMVFKVFTIEDRYLTQKEIDKKFNEFDSCLTAVANNKFHLDEYMQIVVKEIGYTLDRNAMRASRQQQIKNNATLNLTEKEKMIVALCAGSSIKLDVIASALCMNIKTLEFSLTQIYKKLDIVGRLELTHFCISKAIVLNSRNTAGV